MFPFLGLLRLVKFFLPAKCQDHERFFFSKFKYSMLKSSIRNFSYYGERHVRLRMYEESREVAKLKTEITTSHCKHD